jgi:hypothetical protein
LFIAIASKFQHQIIPLVAAMIFFAGEQVAQKRSFPGDMAGRVAAIPNYKPGALG